MTDTDVKQERRKLSKEAHKEKSSVPTLEKLDEAVLKKIGYWVRNKSGMDVLDGACYSRRVEFFKGDEMIDCLTSQGFKKQKFIKSKPELERSEACDLAKQMLNMEFYHRANCTNLVDKTEEELMVLEPSSSASIEDSEDALYIWTLAPSNAKVLFQSGLFLVCAVFLAAIKAWPIWLKIFIWWCALIMLICLSALIVIRLVLYALFMLIGLRGIWLLPNMFNDDLDFLDAFQPLFGTGIAERNKLRAKLRKEEMKTEKLKKKKSLKAKGSKKSKKEGEATEPAKEGAVKGEKPKKKESAVKKEPQVPGRFDDCNFGLINVCVIVILGIIFCNYAGLFMPDNIPDFVVNKADLFAQFPSLAPYNATLDETKANGTVDATVDATVAATVEGGDAQAEEEVVAEEFRQYEQREELGEEEEEVLDEE